MAMMFEAVYENGVLRPLEPLDLPEHQRVELVLTPSSPLSGDKKAWPDAECLKLSDEEADENITLQQVGRALSKISGSLTPDFIAERYEP